MGLEKTFLNDGKSVLLVIEGAFVFDLYEAFFRVLDEIEAAKPDEVVLDLSQCGEIDSAGIGMLLVLRDSLDGVVDSGGRVALRGLQPAVGTLLSVARVDERFELE